MPHARQDGLPRCRFARRHGEPTDFLDARRASPARAAWWRFRLAGPPVASPEGGVAVQPVRETVDSIGEALPTWVPVKTTETIQVLHHGFPLPRECWEQYADWLSTTTCALGGAGGPPWAGWVVTCDCNPPATLHRLVPCHIPALYRLQQSTAPGLEATGRLLPVGNSSGAWDSSSGDARGSSGGHPGGLGRCDGHRGDVSLEQAGQRFDELKDDMAKLETRQEAIRAEQREDNKALNEKLDRLLESCLSTPRSE